MKLYEIKLSEEDSDENQYRVSLVNDPAVEIKLMKFSKESEMPMYFRNEEKRIIYAPAMVPNKKILRRDINGEAAYVFYSEDTVEKYRERYFKSKGNANSNLYHMLENSEGITPVESWTVLDPENDKAKSMGFEVPKGTWMIGMKIDNDEVWNDHIKTSKINGLSIEGGFLHELASYDAEDTQESEEIKSIKMKKETTKLVFEAIRKIAMASDLQEFTDGDLKFYAVDLEVGSIVTDAEGNPMANAELKQGDKVIKTDDMGAILADAPVEEKPQEMEEEMLDAVSTEETPDLAKLQAEIELLKAENEDLKAKLAESEAAQIKAEESLVTMSKHTLSAKPIGLAPVQMTAERFSKMSVREKFEYERSLKNK